jgi:hypothetical protein
MECLKHLGRNCLPIYSVSELCAACGQNKPPILMGYVCTTCGTQFELDGSMVKTDVEEAVTETPPVVEAVVAPVAPKKSRQKKVKDG